jgi:hypothetical protein
LEEEAAAADMVITAQGALEVKEASAAEEAAAVVH